MRSLFLFAALAVLFPTLTVQAQDFKKEVGPIKVIKLELKEPISYEKHVGPMLVKRCTVCHSGNLKEGKLDVSSYESLMKGGKSGEAVKPGKGEESIIYKAMARTGSASMRPRPMPPKGDEPCTPEELALLKLWIDGGAKAPTSVAPPPPILVSVPPANVNPVRALAVSPDKTTVAAGRGNQVHVYDAGGGTHVRTLVAPGLKTFDGKDVKAAHLSIVEAMAWSPDGKYLITGSFREIGIWDALTGEQRHKITGFAHAVVAITFSQDGKYLGVGGGAPTVDGEVKIFEVGTWKLFADIKNCHSDTVYGLAFAPPDMKMRVPGTSEKDNKFQPAFLLATCSADKFVKVWSLPDGKFIKSFEGHTHHVLDIGWMSDGKLLASAGADNTVKIWDFDKGEQARTINAHAKQVTRLVFIGKKAEFLTCGGDNAVKAFNAANGGNIRNFAGGADYIYAVASSPDGAVVAAGGQEGVVRVYNGATAALTKSLLPPGAEPKEKKDEKKK